MTTHEFANQLLAGPDVLVGLQPVLQYDLDNDKIYPPKTFILEGAASEDDFHEGKTFEVLIISSDNDALII